MQLTVNALSYNVVEHCYDEFWTKVRRGEWEPETFAFFDRCISAETVLIDIGAWIGPTVLYGAQIAKRCIAFEPDPVAFEHLRANFAANRTEPWHRKVTIARAAVTADGTPVSFGSRGNLGDSMSSALFGHHQHRWQAQAVRLEQIIAHHLASGTPIFIKLDIEGGEYALLRSLRNTLALPHVTALVSLHPHYLFDHLTETVEPSKVDEHFRSTHESIARSLPWASHRIAYPGQPDLSESALRDRFDGELAPYEITIEPL